MSELIHVEWITGNTPLIKIKRNDVQISVTKQELLALRDEINEFMEFYKEDFAHPNIEWNDLYNLEDDSDYE